MGLMSCSKKGCESILCDYHILGDKYGYICYSCMNEFEKKLKYKNVTSKKEAYKILDKFLSKEKNSYNEDVIDITQIIRINNEY